MKPDLITEGEFKDWLTWTSEAFEYDVAGPFIIAKMRKAL